MRTLNDIPDHLLCDIIYLVVSLTKYQSWQFSLRLVSRQFNEALLYVYYLRQKNVACIEHSFDCAMIDPQSGFCLCYNTVDAHTKLRYAARCTIQSLIAGRMPLRDDKPAHDVLHQWRAALTTLQSLEQLEMLTSDHIQFTPSCSNNPVFRDTPSAVLADAIWSYIGPTSGNWLQPFLCVRDRPTSYNDWPSDFWVALGACVLGNLHLFKRYSSVTKPSTNPSSMSCQSELELVEFPVVFLTVAIKHSSFSIVHHLFEQQPEMMCETSYGHIPLRAAIFSNNNEVLQTLLQRTPKQPDLLTSALSAPRTLLSPSCGASKTVRMLARHFAPLSVGARIRLNSQSCATGDVTLLEEFSQSGPLFNRVIRSISAKGLTGVNYAILYGNVDVLRFLLHYDTSKRICSPNLRTLKQILISNQTDCFQEVDQQFDKWYGDRFRHIFRDLCLAENMRFHIDQRLSYDREYVQASVAGSEDGYERSHAQYGLWNAIQRLRSENVQVLLDAGVPFLPWEARGDPMDIPWPYFHKNRDAFERTQAVLDAFGLPKLRVIV